MVRAGGTYFGGTIGSMTGPLNRYILIRFNSFDSENVIMTHKVQYNTEQS